MESLPLSKTADGYHYSVSHRRYLLAASDIRTKYLPAVIIMLGVLTIILILWAVYKYKTIFGCDDRAPNHDRDIQPTIFSPTIRSVEDLLFLCNDDMSPPLQVIGRGGCGKVYKAVLLTGGRTITVAVKKIVQPVMIDATRLSARDSKIFSSQMRQIRSEIVTVGHVRHPNLLRLLAHVPSRSRCHYLVYDYMRNGSLHDVLKSETRRRGLKWQSRHKIAMGIAAGLEYLHMVHQPKIIHRDLKPANILLDDDMNSCIADFGLAKVVKYATAKSIQTRRVAGTLGYIAPECFRTMSYTDKIDVYSFGVILAVLVTGRFPSDQFFRETEETSMMGWARRVVSSSDPSEAIDSTLLGNGFEREMLLVLKIACFCTYDAPKERPSSRDVLCMLSQIKYDERIV